MSFSDEIIAQSVVPTIQKFCYVANQLGINATAVYNTVAGLTPPTGYSFGRYFDSGDPLLQYAAFSGSVSDLIAQGVALRQTLFETLTALVQTAAEEDITVDLAPAVFGAFTALVNCSARPLDTINAMIILSGFTAPPLNLGSDTVGSEIASLAARTAVLIRVAAIINMGAASALYQPTSQTDAVTIRNQMAKIMDNEAYVVAGFFDDADYSAINAVRVAMVLDLNTRGSVLEPETTYSFNSNLPALVVAYQLYQDTTREADLVARNNPINPALMPLSVQALGQ